MAITATALTASTTNPGLATTYNTDSISPAPNALLLIAVRSWAGVPSSIVNFGTTNRIVTASAGNTSHWLSLWACQCTASPGSIWLSIAFPAAQTQPPWWNVIGVSGHNPASPVPQTVTGGDNHTGSQGQNTGVTLAAPVDTNSRSFYAAYLGSGYSSTSVKAGWTNLTNTAASIDGEVIDWNPTTFDTAPNRSGTSSVTTFNVIGFEVAAAAASAGAGLATLGVGT